MFSADGFFMFVFLRFDRFKVTSESAITTIPTMDIMSGCSFSSNIQLRMAPDTGIRNFQTFNIDTFTPGRFRRTNHIEIAAADKKLSHASATQYWGGNGPKVIPSTGIDTRNNINPPLMSVEELMVSGERLEGDFETSTFA